MIHFSIKPNNKNTVINLFIHREILGISSLEKKGQNYSVRIYDLFISFGINFFHEKYKAFVSFQRDAFSQISLSHIFS